MAYGHSPKRDGGDGQGGSKCPEPVELILYVSSRSPRTAAAIANIKRVLSRFDSSRIRLTVCDLSENPDKGVEDSIEFTPRLVRKGPGPRTYILGHLSNPKLVLEMLGDCKLEDEEPEGAA